MQISSSGAAQMKVLIVMGMIIVFISAFFTFFILDKTFGSYADCRQDIISGKTVCIMSEINIWILAGMLIAGLFVVIGAIAAYLLLSAVTSRRSLCFSSAMQKR